MNTTPDSGAKKGNSISQRITVKLLGIVILVLVLLIPLGMIKSTLNERLQRRDEAVSDITSSWGKEQVLVGPVLVVPYTYTYKTLKDTVVKGVVSKVEVLESATANAWFLPDQLTIEGDIQPEKLHRGIYEAVVYRGSLKFTGRFPSPDFNALKIKGEQIQWDDVFIAVGVTDLRGTAEALKLRLGDESFRMSPGTLLNGFPTGVHTQIGRKAENGKNLSFSMEVGLKGSAGIHFAPLGIQNVVKLASPWPDPSFKGQFLPTERTVTPKGFDALWKVSYYGRAYPQSATTVFPGEQIQASLFGVAFYSAVDSYRMVERAIKYGILFLTLFFAVFFVYETLAGLSIHVVQYTLAGAAMCLFYLGLLSLSEFISFAAAYLISASASVLMLTLYSWTVLHGGRPALLVGGELVAIYVFLYVTLQLQDYSLLLGTAGLFIVLSLIMYATRNMDWQSLDRKITSE